MGDVRERYVYWKELTYKSCVGFLQGFGRELFTDAGKYGGTRLTCALGLLRLLWHHPWASSYYQNLM